MRRSLCKGSAALAASVASDRAARASQIVMRRQARSALGRRPLGLLPGSTQLRP